MLYLGSLAVLLVSAFWQLDPFTGEVVHEPTLKNFQTIAEVPVYRTIALRTIAMAAAVTVAGALLAFPIAYYMARIASKQTRRLLLVAILLPLWASYLVKVYSWRMILRQGGRAQLAARAVRPHGARLLDHGHLARLHLPLAAVHDPADLRGARADPALAARGLGRSRRRGRAARSSGSSCRSSSRRSSPARSSRSRSRSATTSRRRSSRARSSSGTSSTTTSASRTTCRSPRRSPSCPISVMVVYLLLARRAGAFENL